MAEVSNDNLPLDVLFRQFNDASDETDALREKLINRLASQLPDINFQGDKPRDIEVKLAMYKTVDDLLKSKEGSKASRIKTHLQRKDTENTANYQEAAIAMLANMTTANIRVGKVTVAMDIDDQLDKEFEASGQKPILDGELENDIPTPPSKDE